MLVFALALLASDLGLDLLLGGFAAGLITRVVLRKHEVPGFDSKLTAIAFGVFIRSSLSSAAWAFEVGTVIGRDLRWQMPLFFLLFLVVRGTPALLLYRGVLPLR